MKYHFDILLSEIKMLPVHDIMPVWINAASCKNSPYNIHSIAHTWAHGLWMKILMILGNKINPNSDQSTIKYKTKQN